MTTTLPRVFCVYNPGDHKFDPGCVVVPWQNCGGVNEWGQQFLRHPYPTPGWSMADREVMEHLRWDLRSDWPYIAGALGARSRGIAYDPFGWSPDELRVSGWWLRLMNRVGFGAAAAHMRSRLDLLPFLVDFPALATDIYPRTDRVDVYEEAAGLKVNAHVRACVKGGKIPVVLLDLGRSMDMQVGFAKRADGRIRWGLWSDPTEEISGRVLPRAEAVAWHEARAREFVAAMGGAFAA